MSVRSGQSITKVFSTRDYATGAATNDDGTPVGTLYVNGVADAASVTVTNITTGLYSAAVTLPTLAFGDLVDLVILVTVSTIAENVVIWSDTKDIAIDASGAVILADAVDHGGATARLRLGSADATPAFYATNSGGDAVKYQSTGGDGHGFHIAGNTAGHGMFIISGAAGHGIHIEAYAYGIFSQSTDTGSGIYALGANNGDGITAIGGANGHGFGITAGGTIGNGINITTSDGHAISAAATGTDRHGMLLTGGTVGVSDALRCVAGTGGIGIRGILELSQFFTTDSGTTYASAVAGSVVKEIADNAGGSSLTVQAIVDGVWNEATAGHTTAGTTGKALIDAGSGGDPWGTALPGAYASGTAGFILGTNLNATITSRMATYTQPTGFLAATFPATVASTTNITAGTITTATNVTTVNGLAAGVITAAAIADGAIDAATFATDAISGTAVSAAAVTKIQAGLATTGAAMTLTVGERDAVAAALLDLADGIETSYTMREAMRLILAGAAGKTSGASTSTFTIRDVNDTVNRIVATVSSGNRTALTLNVG